MKPMLFAYVSSLLTMLALDAAWLGLMFRPFYRPRMAHLLGEGVQLAPAIAFYLLYSIGLCILVVHPALERGLKPAPVLALGAVYGLVAYGTYDLTNHATLKNWPLAVTLADMAWGALLTAIMSLVAATAARAAG